MANDAGGFYFGSYSGLGGGTYFYPTPGAGTATYYDAGPDGCATYCGCDTNLSPSSFTTGNAGALSFSGEVVTYSGAGTWLYKCVDASSYTGIQLTVSGSTNDQGADGGTNQQMEIMLWELENWNVASAGGSCLAADGGPGDNTMCSPALATVTLPGTSGTVQVPFSQFMGGAPKTTIDDPGHIMQVQVQLPWDHCQTGTGYMPGVSISSIGFYH
jgi:hypothetical protein